jgi:hypothetical protein
MITIKFILIILAIAQWIRFKYLKAFDFDEDGNNLFQSLLLVGFTIGAILASIFLITEYLP